VEMHVEKPCLSYKISGFFQSCRDTHKGIVSSHVQLSSVDSRLQYLSHIFFGNVSHPRQKMKTWQSGNKLFKTESSKTIYWTVKKVWFSVWFQWASWFASLWNCNREKTQL